MDENCNGILRRSIPKGTDLNKISEYRLEEIFDKINGKPSCRPFGDSIMFDNKIYVVINEQKNVSKQIAKYSCL